jgi:enoyl-CoA hydratase/carnithine racemase
VSLVRVSVEGGVATLRIDAGPINLMTVEMFKQLSRAIEAVAGDSTVQAVVLRSANPEWFIAHFDVEAILGFPTDAPPASTLNNFHRMCEMLRTMPKATIAVIEGRVGGGGSEVALSCDMRFATPNAIFNQPEVAIGLIPGGSGTVRLPRLIGRSRAMEVILGCEDIDAATAERWGWVNRVLPTEQIDAFVERLATRIAGFPTAAVIAAKRSVLAAESGVHEDLLAEGDLFTAVLSDPAGRAAMESFLAAGGQTPEGERRLGDLAGELNAS